MHSISYTKTIAFGLVNGSQPSQILVYAVTEIEIDQYTLIEQSVY